MLIVPVLNRMRNGMESMQSVDCDRGVTLFVPFSTSKKSGMGMGLSIGHVIVIAHGGRLDFHSNEVVGVTFFFTLPAAGQED